MDWPKLPDSFRHHIQNPQSGGTFEQYSATKHLKLGVEIARHGRIYLDTKYWVRLRDVYRDRARSFGDTTLFELLMQLREMDKIVCPCSYSVITELMHQTDIESRKATAELMDQLSGGICLQPPHILFAIELDHWLHSIFLPKESLHNQNHLVWTKAFYFVGMPRLRCDGLSPDQIVAFEKTSLDAMWQISVVQLCEMGRSEGRTERELRDEDANTLSVGKFEHHDDGKSFNDLYSNEIWGGLEAHDAQIQTVFDRLMRKTGFVGEASVSDLKQASEMLRKLIATACWLGKLSVQLPQAHINASLHAALRADKSRRYKIGDCEDFRHAGSALPYCQLFLTENSLSHLLCTPPLQLDRSYDVTVTSDVEQSIEAVRQFCK